MLSGLSDAWARGPANFAELAERYPQYPLSLSEQRPGMAGARLLDAPVPLAELESILSQHPGSAFRSTAPVRSPIDAELVHPPPVARECWRTGRALLSVASSGAQCRLHVDVDYSHGLHLVVAGTLRFFLFPPASAPRLQADLNRSSLPFHLRGQEERRRLAEQAMGQEVVVGPGESLFIPKHWWYQVEHLERSVGITWRFGRSPAQNLLSLVVRWPIAEIVQLSETLESGRTGTLRWAMELLSVLTQGGDEQAMQERLADFLERSHRMRVPPQHRQRSRAHGVEGFDVLRQLPAPLASTSLRTRSAVTFDFLSPKLSQEALEYLAGRTLAEEVRDPSSARAAFVLDLWPWLEVPADPAALRLTIAGLRDPSRSPA